MLETLALGIAVLLIWFVATLIGEGTFALLQTAAQAWAKGWKRLFGYGGRALVLDSDDTADEVGRRFARRIREASRLFGRLPAGELAGRLREAKDGWLRGRDHWGVYLKKGRTRFNLWSPTFRGRLEDSFDGCVLKGEIQTTDFGRVLSIVALFALLAGVGLSMAGWVFQGMVSTGLFVGLLGVARLGVWHGRKKELEELKRELRDVMGFVGKLEQSDAEEAGSLEREKSENLGLGEAFSLSDDGPDW